MAQAAAPRGTRAATAAVLAALAKLPVEHRAAAFRHVSVAVKEKLAKDTARAKAAAKAKPVRGKVPATSAKARASRAKPPEAALRDERRKGTAPKANMLAAGD